MCADARIRASAGGASLQALFFERLPSLPTRPPAHLSGPHHRLRRRTNSTSSHQSLAVDFHLRASPSLGPLISRKRRLVKEVCLETRIMAATFTRFPELPQEIRLMVWKAALPPRIVELCQRNLKVTVGEWEWENCPTDRTEQDCIDHYMELDGDKPRIHKMLGFESWNDLLNTPYAPAGSYHFEDREWIARIPLRHPMPGLCSAQLPNQIQSIMSTCRESYHTASRYYRQVFGTHAAFPETYFDFQRDTLYLRCDTVSIYRPYVSGIFLPLRCITDRKTLTEVENLAVYVVPHFHWHFWGTSLNFIVCALKKFTNLRNFSFIVDHYGREDGPNEPCFFIDPIHADETMQVYEKFARKPYGYGREPIEVPTEPKLPLKWVQVDLEKLEVRRVRCIREGEIEWKIPKIHYKVAVSPSYMDALEDGRRRCEAIVAQNNKEYATDMRG